MPPKQPVRQAPKQHKLLQNFLYVVLAGVFAIVFWQRQNIVDWIKLSNYDPPVAIVQLAAATDMTDYGRKIWYLNKPQIQDKQPFYQSCVSNETTIVLGCYKPPEGIYLLKVTDSRLAGIEEVTAAHEMLHAAYDRLNSTERNRVAKLIDQFYATLDNPEVKAKIDLYKQEGADVTNELHSILGTEVGTLTPELEAYYSQYFESRAKVIALANQYQAVFTDLRAKIANYDSQLKDLETKVKANNETLKQQDAALTAESARLDGLLRSGSIAAYNQGVPAYNQSLVPYRNLLNETRSLVDKYSTILDQRNAVAQEAQELNKALDTSLQPTVSDK